MEEERLKREGKRNKKRKNREGRKENRRKIKIGEIVEKIYRYIENRQTNRVNLEKSHTTQKLSTFEPLHSKCILA